MHLPSSLLLLSAAPIAAATFTLPNPFERVKGSAETSDRGALRVDLGYEVYEGVGNATTGVDTYRGYVTGSLLFLFICIAFSEGYRFRKTMGKKGGREFG